MYAAGHSRQKLSWEIGNQSSHTCRLASGQKSIDLILTNNDDDDDNGNPTSQGVFLGSLQRRGEKKIGLLTGKWL